MPSPGVSFCSIQDEPKPSLPGDGDSFLPVAQLPGTPAKLFNDTYYVKLHLNHLVQILGNHMYRMQLLLWEGGINLSNSILCYCKDQVRQIPCTMLFMCDTKCQSTCSQRETDGAKVRKHFLELR